METLAWHRGSHAFVTRHGRRRSRRCLRLRSSVRISEIAARSLSCRPPCSSVSLTSMFWLSALVQVLSLLVPCQLVGGHTMCCMNLHEQHSGRVSQHAPAVPGVQQVGNKNSRRRGLSSPKLAGARRQCPTFRAAVCGAPGFEVRRGGLVRSRLSCEAFPVREIIS